MPESIDFQAALGHDRIRARRRRLADHARRRLTGLRGLEPATPEPVALSGGMVAFRLPEGTRADELRRGLRDRFRVEVAVAERPDRPLLRVSTNFYNTEAEVDRLADALEESKELMGD